MPPMHHRRAYTALKIETDKIITCMYGERVKKRGGMDEEMERGKYLERAKEGSI